MSITDDIQQAISSKILLCYESENSPSCSTANCVICKQHVLITSKFYLYVKGEGQVCDVCAERFAPDKYKIMLENREKNIQTLITDTGKMKSPLTSVEMDDINDNFEALISFAEDLSKGVARGIIEAPSGHIGLLYLAKDIVRPDRKEGESDKDYELRVKSFRIQKLQEKIRKETVGRIAVLRNYFEKSGLSE